MPEGSKLLPGYDGEYAVSADGTVWSCKSGEWSEKRTWMEHGHATVELWRFGLRTRRRVKTLVEDLFGQMVEVPNDLPLLWYLRRQYGGRSDVQEFLQTF